LVPNTQRLLLPLLPGEIECGWSWKARYFDGSFQAGETTRKLTTPPIMTTSRALEQFVAPSSDHAQEVNGSTTDSIGHAIEPKVVRAISGNLDDGEPIEFGEAAVADFPPLLEQHGLGGLLSPQLLANATEMTALDLRTPELRIEPLDAAMPGRGVPRVEPVDGANVCVNRDSAFMNHLYSIPVVLSGIPASLLVDSGASCTIVSPSSAAGRFELAGTRRTMHVTVAAPRIRRQSE
jgi:hypothetical protein